jgi:imidazolonepropionase
MPGAATLLFGAHQVVTCAAAPASCVHADSAVLIRNDRVAAIGSEQELGASAPEASRIDCQGCTITPGLVDSHTHAVFGAWRAHEYELRSRGLSYMEIARQGGGINASVRDVRARSEDELLELSIPRAWDCLRSGTTTIEIKSGYGLRTSDELKLLHVIRRLREHVPINIVPTFLGAHEFPPEYRDDRQAYVDLLINEMIPAVAEAQLAVFCDVFMEPGVFDAEQSQRIMEAGRAHGLVPKLHADEFTYSGAAELAVELGAASADHLGAVSPAGIAALAASTTVATLLPTTLFFLGKSAYAPARQLLDAGATVALATDFNPGTSPSVNLPLAMTIACSHMRMDPLEALIAATRGGARALRLDDGEGTITPGGPADLVVWSAADYREIPYRFASPIVRETWVRGQRIVNSL